MILHQQSGPQRSILVLGATDRTGRECIRKLFDHNSKPQVHAFCRDASRLVFFDKALCASVIEGDAQNEGDLERALAESRADVVIVSIGNGDILAKSDIRAVSAFALATVLKKIEFSHVSSVVISSVGAGNSKIIIGLGIGSLISNRRRHFLHDHTRQELAFSDLEDRTFIVRATALASNKATGKLVTFGDQERHSSMEIDRADLASWLAGEICGKEKIGGRVVNVSGTKM